ncbi:uncharacterized protein VTP21DRAFT_7368 [Calcarisporiella thermophila]|uniref:uncharacterized protein n=1 Tax=Calcarisporiella thermophila TaxID=911321 RepID=UPI003742D2AD
MMRLWPFLSFASVLLAGIVSPVLGHGKHAHHVQKFSEVGHFPHNNTHLKIAHHESHPKHSMRYKHPELCDKNVKQISGYIDTPDDKHFFFWFFEARHSPNKKPLVLWLNGGPGCSSMTGLLMELGPCQAKEDGSDVIYNKYGWNEDANMLFLDQPINTGFSYGPQNITDTFMAMEDMYAFLQLFYKEFPEYGDLPFHIAGESYAGHYIPYAGYMINRMNQGKYLERFEHHQHLKKIPLQSLLIGNGLTEEISTYQYYHKQACDGTYGRVLPEKNCTALEEKMPAMIDLIKKCYETNSDEDCGHASNTAPETVFTYYQLNAYDVRKSCVDTSGGLCYKILDGISTFLNKKEVQEQIGVDRVFKSCTYDIYNYFVNAGDYMRRFDIYLPEVLESNIRVLIYAGDADFICHWYGNKAWSLRLDWEGHEEFKRAKDRKWYVNGRAAGEVRATNDNRFSFVRVYRAGHMVPYDQPKNSLSMFSRWIKNKPLY